MVSSLAPISYKNTAAYRWREQQQETKRGYYSDPAVVARFVSEVMECLNINRYTLGRFVQPDDPQYVYKWLNGTRRPSARANQRIGVLLMAKLNNTFDPHKVPIWDDEDDF
jgi:hypothetical protein